MINAVPGRIRRAGWLDGRTDWSTTKSRDMTDLVLAVGNFGRHAYAHHWKGIRQGFASIPGVLFESLDFRDAVGAHPISNKWEPGRDQAVADAIDKINPDVVVFGVQDAMTDRVLDACVRCGSFVALWFCDLRAPVPRDLGGRLHLLALTNAGLVDDYAEAWGIGRANIIWLPQACLKREAPAPFDERFGTDVAFVGTWGHVDYHWLRRQVFGQVEGRVGKPRIIPALDGVRYPNPGFHLYCPMTDDQKAIITRSLPEIYSGAKVAIGISDPVAGYHSNRIFLATGHGAFYFCNWFEGVDVLFEDEKEIETFDPFRKDYLDRLEWLVSDLKQAADYRAEVRAAAFRRAQADHTYEERIRVLWKAIQDRR